MVSLNNERFWCYLKDIEVLHFLRQLSKFAVKLCIKILYFTLGQTLQWR